MNTVELLLSQVAISLLVVVIYDVLQLRRRQVAPAAAPPATQSPPLVSTPSVPSAVAPQTKAVPVAEPMPPEILAVIAAAIAVVLGEQYKVVSVQPTAAPMPEVNVWALEGRLDQFQSHRVR